MNEVATKLRQGQIIDGRYEVVRPLGRGGFASVYEARHLQLDRPAALKVLDPVVHGADEQFRRRFMSEARIAASLDHPNIVRIFDFGFVSEDVPYIAMEHLDGVDLSSYLAAHRAIHPDRALRLFRGVLDALRVGHEMGVVHKDLKPSNIFVSKPDTPEERLVILDYGIARLEQDDSPRLTQTGSYTGTPQYLPPEYIREQLITTGFDVYQIGLILIEALVGEPVIQAQTTIAALVAHVEGQHVIPDELRNSPAGDVLLNAISVDPHERFQNAGALMAALSQVEIDPKTLGPLAQASHSSYLERAAFTAIDLDSAEFVEAPTAASEPSWDEVPAHYKTPQDSPIPTFSAIKAPPENREEQREPPPKKRSEKRQKPSPVRERKRPAPRPKRGILGTLLMIIGAFSVLSFVACTFSVLLVAVFADEEDLADEPPSSEVEIVHTVDDVHGSHEEINLLGQSYGGVAANLEANKLGMYLIALTIASSVDWHAYAYRDSAGVEGDWTPPSRVSDPDQSLEASVDGFRGQWMEAPNASPDLPRLDAASQELLTALDAQVSALRDIGSFLNGFGDQSNATRTRLHRLTLKGDASARSKRLAFKRLLYAQLRSHLNRCKKERDAYFGHMCDVNLAALSLVEELQKNPRGAAKAVAKLRDEISSYEKYSRTHRADLQRRFEVIPHFEEAKSLVTLSQGLSEKTLLSDKVYGLTVGFMAIYQVYTFALLEERH